MNIGVPSRFACLKIEDDDFRSGSSGSKKKTDNKQNKKPANSAKEAPKNVANSSNLVSRKGSSSATASNSEVSFLIFIY